MEFVENKSENKKNFIYQEPNQLLLRNYLSMYTPYESVLLYHNLGVGKCMGIDTDILMFDGTIKKVQDIKVGDLLMGDNSTPRTVLSLARGKDQMYDIIPVKGERYRVNKEHILCLKASGYPKLNKDDKNNNNYNVQWIENNKFNSKTFTYNNTNINSKKKEAEIFFKKITNEQIIEIAIKDYLKLSDSKKGLLKGYKVPIDFPEKDLPIDPYMIGFWLGDGSKRSSIISSQDAVILHYYIGKYDLTLNYQSKYSYRISWFTGKSGSNKFLTTLKELNLINNKHIPMIYKCNSRENRLKLLAGLLDSDGNLCKSKAGYEFNQSLDHFQIIDDIIYLCRSLGFSCYKNKKKTSWTYKGVKKFGEAWRIIISGVGIEEIPVLCKRKKANPRRQIKDVLVTGIKVEYAKIDNYYGFTVDDNHRYLIGDFTVTHNSCSAITIAEGFKEYIYNMNKKVVVLVKNNNIKKNFTDELLSKCTNEEYISNEENDIINRNVKSTVESRNEINVRVSKEINKTYQFINYGTFINQVLGAKDFEKNEFGQTTKRPKKDNLGNIKRKRIKDEIKNFNNTVVIVDEAHNITGNDVYRSLLKVLKNSYNYRLVLLTATPMYDNSTEIFELSNLLNANNKKLEMPTSNDLVKKGYLTKDKSDNMNTALKGGIYTITDFGKNELYKALKGKTSYLQSNIINYPTRIDMGEPVSKSNLVKVVFCKMSMYQYKIYINALQTDLQKSGKIDISSIVKNLESNENILENTVASKSNSLYTNCNDASTMVYPNDLYGKDGFSSCFTKVNSRITINKGNKDILTTNLKTYSCKLYNLLQNINKNSTGKIFIYSNYVNNGGTSLVKQLLINNGFHEYTGGDTSESKYYKSFIMFDENAGLKTRSYLKNMFNKQDNKDGKFIRILIGSPIIAEGITLLAVRQVHLLEPYWNMSKINQIIGRSIRNYSHASLPLDDQNVEIYKYVSIYGEPQDINNNELSQFFIDREKYILSEEKDKSNKVIERLLKEISFDCDLNKTRNKLNGTDGSPECDYTTCDFKCSQKSNSEQIDKSTYNMYIQFFDQFDIYYVLESIKYLFSIGFIWELSDIKEYIHNLEPLITDEAIYTTLDYIVKNKVYMTDLYNREGFIIQRNSYYIFNEFNIDINSSIYSKILDFSVYKNKYTFGNYSKNLLHLDLFEKNKHEPVSIDINDIDLLTPEQINYNEQIENNYPIYGSFRMKKSKNDTWEHKYGKRDEIFRILDFRNTSINKDNRKNIKGKTATSYDIADLKSIAKALDLVITETHQKNDIIKLIQKALEVDNRILL